jgi:transposase
MPFQPQRAALVLGVKETAELRRISNSRSEKQAHVLRARILLAYQQLRSISAIARDLKVSRPLVERCVDKALGGGIKVALADLPRAGRPAVITPEAKTWVTNLACTKPTEHGYAAELWTFNQLSSHVRSHCVGASCPCLARAGKSMIHNILSEHPITPHKITYYLERRDPDFDIKMAQVLVVYHDVAAINDAPPEQEADRKHVTISYDEKPGIQAIGSAAPDLPPVPGKYATLGRDYEYKRFGTISLIAGMDLHTGHIIGLVRDRHRSREFIEFLAEVDAHYPQDWHIRIILDNHSAHISKEVMAWMKGHPNRFEFVFTPKHGSWLNLIEVFFSKMTRAFLRSIRVKTKAELVSRIEKYLAEVNAAPVVFRWYYKMDEVLI